MYFIQYAGSSFGELGKEQEGRRAASYTSAIIDHDQYVEDAKKAIAAANAVFDRDNPCILTPAGKRKLLMDE